MKRTGFGHAQSAGAIVLIGVRSRPDNPARHSKDSAASPPNGNVRRVSAVSRRYFKRKIDNIGGLEAKMTGEKIQAAGRRVLIVEDEVLICMLIETILDDAGYQVALAHSVPEALEAIEQGQVDLAILDLNLRGKKVYPVAERLAARGTPFIFATGGGALDIEGFPGRPWVAKPFDEYVLLAEVAKVFA
jgi:CheY-like chemotaxis protein